MHSLTPAKYTNTKDQSFFPRETVPIPDRNDITVPIPDRNDITLPSAKWNNIKNPIGDKEVAVPPDNFGSSNVPCFLETSLPNDNRKKEKLFDQLEEKESKGSELIPTDKATVPSQPNPGIQAQVELILSRCFKAPVAVPTNCGIPEDKFYLGWSAATLLGTATSDLTRWISFCSSQLRIVDGYLTHIGYKKDLPDCLDYLNAKWAICELTKLKEPKPSKEDLDLINDAEAKVKFLAHETYSAFAKYAADVSKLAAKLGYSRDVFLSGISTLHGGNTIAAEILKGVEQTQLGDSAKEFLGAVPFLGPSLGIISGLTSSIQGILEAYSASDLKKALLEAERLEKKVFASSDFGDADIQKLLSNLIWHRQQRRDLELLKAKLLKYHGAFRATNGVIGIGASATAITLLALGGAAVFGALTMGISAIVGGVAGGLFLLWVNIRSTIAQHVQKSYDKVWRAINDINQRGPQNITELPTDSSRLTIQDISDAFAQKIAEPATKAKTVALLKALGIPELIAESADTDGGKQLADYLIPPRGIPVTNEDALRKVYLGRGTAQEKMHAVREWLADPDLQETDLKQIAKKTDEKTSDKNTLAWSKYLAPGENMGNICKSKLTSKLIQKYWEEEAFKTYMVKSLGRLGEESFGTAGDAWKSLQSRREETKTQEKARATVAAWINGMKVDSIQNCLASAKKDALTSGYKEVLGSFGIGTDCKDIKSINTALRTHVSTTDLNVNTIGNFMAVYKATLENDKEPLCSKMNEFLQRTHSAMHKDEQVEFMLMLGVKDNVFSPLEAKQMDAMLGKIHKFLLVSEKLHAQTLTKVIASLHEYPTDGSIPKDVARIAAIRELRARCSAANNETDVKHALALAKELSSGKLHKRTFGAGEGGGVLGFGGYRLNEKGKIVRELVERCLGQGSPINSFSADMAKHLRATAKQNFSDEYVEALTHWTKKLIGEVVEVDKTALSKLADTLDFYRTPGKLEKALESSDSDVDGPAITYLKNRLTIASEQLEKTAAVWENPITRMEFDSSSFVTQLTEFFSLQKLATEYKLTCKNPVLPSEIKDRLKFYRAALEWPNKTARAKNITAIKRELDNLKTGALAANPFWSAKFLNSQPNWVEEESKRMRTRYDWLKPGDSYKSLVKKVNALDSMRLSSLHRAVERGDPVGNNWINNQFALYGLEKPNLEDLREAAKKGKIDFLEAFVKMRNSACVAKVENEIVESMENRKLHVSV